MIHQSYGSCKSHAEKLVDPIAKPLTRKAKKYKELDRPLIVAIGTSRMLTQFTDNQIADVLFGSTSAVIASGQVVGSVPSNDGILLQGEKARKTSVSGLILVEGFGVSFLGSLEPRIYLNPNATHQLDPEGMAMSSFIFDSATKAFVPAYTESRPETEIFGVAPGWPGHVPFGALNADAARAES